MSEDQWIRPSWHLEDAGSVSKSATELLHDLGLIFPCCVLACLITSSRQL